MESRKKVLVVGYGSIGERHCRLLNEKGHEVAVVSRRTDVPFVTFQALLAGLEAFAPDHVLVTNATSSHRAALGHLASCGFQGSILVEKPLFDSVPETVCPSPEGVYVAYNLRFHPIIRKVREIIAGKKLYSAQFYVGQYLPLWRPGTDYRQCYSAHASQGGGALKDLSHELDLAQWLTGSWKRVSALGGKYSDLEIDSDDVFCLLLETANCPAVSVQVNYLDLKPRREMIINAEGVSVQADFVSGRLVVNDDVEEHDVARDHTYAAQLDALVSGKTDTMCSYAQGLDVMKLIDAAENAARDGVWIQNS
ncbi:Gfo/Idh/MocA family protein [Desulfoplanes sp. PS50]|jgi:predicted dehydrogenase